MNQVVTIPNKAILASIQHVLDTIPDVLPIPKKHKHDLSFAIRDLSRMLTEERGYLNRSYWSSPRFLSAYVYYFLPWNLYRLSSLIPNITLPLLPGSCILDLGSGPLTMPLALWCSRPDLRSIPLHFVCSDIAQKPMDIGLEVIQSLSLESPWTFSLERGPLEKIIGSKKRVFHLIMGGNVLNELTAPKGMTLEERIGNITRSFPSRLAKGAMLFFVEPGTRLGGKMISLTRKAGIGCGFDPLAPCTHANPCPVIEQNFYYEQAPAYNGWCHFLCDISNIPQELNALTVKAGFKRESLALSFLQMLWNKESESSAYDENSFDLDDLEALYRESMQRDDSFTEDVSFDIPCQQSISDKQKHIAYDTMNIEGGHNSHTKRSSVSKTMTHCDTNESRGSQSITSKNHAKIRQTIQARIISSDIRLAETTARYACSEVGLLLATGARYAAFGENIQAKCRQPLVRDAKTSAIMAEKVYGSGQEEKQKYKASSNRQRNRQAQGKEMQPDATKKKSLPEQGKAEKIAYSKDIYLEPLRKKRGKKTSGEQPHSPVKKKRNRD